MTILIVNTLYYPTKFGGAEKSVQILAEQLVEFGHKVIVACLTDNKEKSYYHNGVRVYTFSNKNIYWAFNSKTKKTNSLLKVIWHIVDTYSNLQKENILNVMHREKPDIVHVNNICGFSAGMLRTIKKHDVPVVQTLRDYYYLCYKTTCYNKTNCKNICTACKLSGKFKLKNLNNYADYTVGISQFIIDKFHENGLQKDIPSSIIYNAVVERGKSLRNSNIDNTKVTFGFIGSVTTAKGVEFMLEVFESIKTESQNFKIKIAGQGSTKYVKDLANKYSHLDLEFVGFQNSKEFYQSINALVVPSQWDEPFGRVVIEGAKYNLPIFVSEYGGLPELKKKLKFVKNFNSATIKDFLKLSGETLYTYNLREFSSKETSKTYENLYAKLLNNEG